MVKPQKTYVMDIQPIKNKGGIIVDQNHATYHDGLQWVLCYKPEVKKVGNKEIISANDKLYFTKLSHLVNYFTECIISDKLKKKSVLWAIKEVLEEIYTEVDRLVNTVNEQRSR